MWVDLFTKIGINDKGLVTSIKQKWIFGEFFSASLIDEIVKNKKGINKGLVEEISQILANLEEYDYFTNIKVNKVKTSVGKVKKFNTGIQDTRIWIEFDVPIIQPVNIEENNLTYSIFDPTYYIEMLHLENAKISFVGGIPNKCSAEIIQPNPSDEVIVLSKSPTLDMTPDKSIGKLFAEVVRVSCQK
tara:strand:- start:3268 stop:3831 length:564 start_codon:yes stop_codon:yes gene_type:complete